MRRLFAVNLTASNSQGCTTRLGDRLRPTRPRGLYGGRRQFIVREGSVVTADERKFDREAQSSRKDPVEVDVVASGAVAMTYRKENPM